MKHVPFLETKQRDGGRPRRFVLLHHVCPAGYPRPTHYDLMLEADGALRTWALERLPAPGESVFAERLADHRLAYLDYEGSVSGGRGEVVRCDSGRYHVISEDESTLSIELAGERIRGVWKLSPLEGGDQRWRCDWASG